VKNNSVVIAVRVDPLVRCLVLEASHRQGSKASDFVRQALYFQLRLAGLDPAPALESDQ
jgi:hypothetical protein